MVEIEGMVIINEIAAKCFFVCFTITCDSTEWYSLIVHTSEQVAVPKKPGAPGGSGDAQ